MAHSIAVRRVMNSSMQWGTVPVLLGLDDCTVKHVKEKENYTDFDSLGYRESATCVQAFECTAKGAWNAAQNYLDPTVGNPTYPALYAQDNGGPAKINISSLDPTFFYMPVVTIPSASTDMSMAGKLVKFSMDFESNGGPIIGPIGNFGQQNN